MFIGEKDALANPIDAKWAYETAGSSVYHNVIPAFNHGSFLLAKDMSFMNDVMA